MKKKISETPNQPRKAKAQKQPQKVSIIHSMAMKIILLVVAASIVATLTSSRVYVYFVENQTKSIIQNNMMDLAEMYASIYNSSFSSKHFKGEDCNALLAEAKLKGVEGSYAYLVNREGIMVSHPTESKIGQPVENAVVSGLVADLKAGNRPEDAVVSYEYQGAIKYAAYSITNNNSILVISADENEVMAFTKTLDRYTIYVCLFNIVFFSIAGFIFSLFLTKPLTVLTSVIQKTANLDFTSTGLKNKKQRKDEIGAITIAIGKMRGSLRVIVNDLTASSDNLNDKVSIVEASGQEINDMCSDASSTTEELAAGMQETAAATETINGNITTMQKEAVGIHNLSTNGEALSESIMERAEQLSQKTDVSNKRTQSMYAEVKEKTNKAIEDSKAVSKINDLTAAIMSISSQTSLLALNANIEAARAGEAGKGFAVVATEIGNLANQSSEAVGNINEIVVEVNEVVSRMAETLTSSLDFLENVVIEDYKQFSEVSIQYKEDATTFKNSMMDIENSIRTLTDSIDNAATSLNGISSTVSEATVGVTEIATKTSDIVAKTTDNNTAVDDCLNSINHLKELASRFTM